MRILKEPFCYLEEFGRHVLVKIKRPNIFLYYMKWNDAMCSGSIKIVYDTIHEENGDRLMKF